MMDVPAFPFRPKGPGENRPSVGRKGAYCTVVQQIMFHLYCSVSNTAGENYLLPDIRFSSCTQA